MQAEGRKQPKPLLKPICPHCKTDNIVRDANAEWDKESQTWTLRNEFDDTFCCNCERDIEAEWIEIGRSWKPFSIFYLTGLEYERNTRHVRGIDADHAERRLRKWIGAHLYRDRTFLVGAVVDGFIEPRDTSYNGDALG